VLSQNYVGTEANTSQIDRIAGQVDKWGR